MGWKELVPIAFALRREHIVQVNRRAVLITESGRRLSSSVSPSAATSRTSFR